MADGQCEATWFDAEERCWRWQCWSCGRRQSSTLPASDYQRARDGMDAPCQGCGAINRLEEGRSPQEIRQTTHQNRAEFLRVMKARLGE